MLGHKAKKRRPPKRPPHMLKSVVALPASIDVPRTMAIGLTDAALNSPTRSAAIPYATTVIIIIMPVVVRAANANMYAGRIEINLRLHRDGRSNCRRADKTQRNSSFC
jgi:hypothetical protein